MEVECQNNVLDVLDNSTKQISWEFSMTKIQFLKSEKAIDSLGPQKYIPRKQR